jgi:putative transposase
MWTDKDREKYKDDGRRYPSDLTDAEWNIIKPLFRGYFTFTADMREVVNACFYLEHTGCQWRALPSDFGPHQTVRTWYDRFRADGVWAQAGADLTRRVRQAHGHTSEPTTGLLDSQSVVSGPQPGERGYDGNKKIRGIKRHVLSCSLGFVLAVVVTPASVHDTKAAEIVLDRAVENGFTIKRAKVDAIYTGPTINAVSGLYKVEFQILLTLPYGSTRETEVKGFAPLPLRWRIEATFGTGTNRYRRLTRNLEQQAKSAEDAFELAHFRRVLRVYARDVHSIA